MPRQADSLWFRSGNEDFTVISPFLSDGMAVRPGFWLAMGSGIGETGGVHATRAILIRSHPLTDTSLIVHWLTEEHGLVRTVAKGARRPKSVFAGRLDLFFGGEIQFVRSRAGDLHTLREVVIRDWREGLRGSYASLLLAGYWCRLLGMVLEPEHPDPAFHDLLARALRHIEEEGASRRALLHFERELVRLLGMAHESRPPAEALREMLGGLPEIRAELLERLAGHMGNPPDHEITAGQNPEE